jgi:hypothetical protein
MKGGGEGKSGAGVYTDECWSRPIVLGTLREWHPDTIDPVFIKEISC